MSAIFGIRINYLRMNGTFFYKLSHCNKILHCLRPTLPVMPFAECARTGLELWLSVIGRGTDIAK